MSLTPLCQQAEREISSLRSSRGAESNRRPATVPDESRCHRRCRRWRESPSSTPKRLFLLGRLDDDPPHVETTIWADYVAGAHRAALRTSLQLPWSDEIVRPAGAGAGVGLTSFGDCHCCSCRDRRWVRPGSAGADCCRSGNAAKARDYLDLRACPIAFEQTTEVTGTAGACQGSDKSPENCLQGATPAAACVPARRCQDQTAACSS